MGDRTSATRGCTEIDEPDRLAGNRTRRPGNAGNGNREVDRRMGEGALGHLVSTFGADCAVDVDGRGRHAKHLLLGFVGVSNKAAIENGR